MNSTLWFFAVAIGPLLLGGAMAYILIRRRRLRADQKQRQEKATRQMYDRN